MAKQKSAAATAANSPSSNSLYIIAFSGSALAFLAAAASLLYLALIQLPANNAKALEASAQRTAEAQATSISQSIDQLEQRLLNFANSTDLTLALDTGDNESLERLQRELERSFPEASSARLIKLGPLGIAGLDRRQARLKNSIEADILRRVSGGENVEAEAYRHQQRWIFSLAKAVPGAGDYSSGALFISIDGSHLEKLLGQIDGALGRSELIQSGVKTQAIAASGQANGGQASTSDTQVSRWQVQFTPSATMRAQAQSPEPLWLMLALVALAATAGAALSLGSLKKALCQNLDLLEQGADSGYSLPGFSELAQQQLQQRKQFKLQAAATAQQAEASKSPEHQTGIVVEEPTIEEAAPEGPLDRIPSELPEHIFRAYDIRGIADTELNNDNCFAIGLAIGTAIGEAGQSSVVVAADGRHSSPRIREALCEGLQASGRDVIDIGTVPTPLMYFATCQLETQSGVMITGSHNPSEYNGIKIVVDGRALSGEAISDLHQRIRERRLDSGEGQYQLSSIDQDYVDYIVNDVAIAQPLKVVIDAGNGVAGHIAPRLFEELGCEVIPLYCEIDGDFPNHHPDPSVAANMQDLIAKVRDEQADLGIAFDGDADRLGVVTADGELVPADRLLMLLAQDVVSRNPGADILFDVKCTRNLNTLISNYGGRPIMWKTGHSFMKEKMQETGALLGGEYSGHIFFKERWFGFDDGMYAAARLIEILSTTDPDLEAHLMAFPDSVASPELKVESDDQRKFTIVDQLATQAQFGDGKVSQLDGIRVDFPDGWGLVRPSNTTPMLILRFEGDDEAALERIKLLFKEQLSAVDNSLEFGF